MKSIYYYHTIRKTIIQVLDLFNDIHIAKYGADGAITKTVPVPLRFATKEKFYFWLNEKKSFEKRLPSMCMAMTSIGLDKTRITNNVTPVSFLDKDNQYNKFLIPAPYNCQFKLLVVTGFLSEADQILEQILPYFDPEVLVNVDIPEINNKFNVKVILDSVNMIHDPVTRTQDDYRLVQWELDFTAQTYLFKPITEQTMIEKTISRFYSNQDSFDAMQKIAPSATDSLPVSANHDFDTETAYMKGVILNDMVTVVENEIFEGN